MIKMMINAKMTFKRHYYTYHNYYNGIPIVYVWAALCVICSESQTFAQGWSVPVTGNLDFNASAVVGRTAALPCDIQAPSEDDKTHIVLWYKQDSVNPIYTLDLRDKKTPTPTQYPEGDIRSRTTFFYKETSPYLLISNVTADDQGLYRCRVDFKNARTRNRLVNLNIVVPPKVPSILGEKGLGLESRIGPYNEGSSLFLSCEVVGGRPPPKVSWLRDSVVLDDSYEVTSLGIVRNDFKVQSLSRDDFGATFICQATNNDITPPVSSTVTVDMNLKPLEVTILDTKRPLVANKQYRIMCQSVGSRPPPIISWWKEDKRLKRAEEVMSEDKNVTTSILSFTPTSDDNGLFIRCRTANPAITGSNITDGWQLDVHFVPIVSVHPGDSVRLNNIGEGDDVYLECKIRSNPPVTHVEWQFEDKILTHNPSGGVITSNQSLVLQKVRRQNSGAYSCLATNTQGTGKSKSIYVTVNHSPVCQPSLKTSYRVAREETVKIVCEVDASPADVVFKWTTSNTTNNEREVLSFMSEKTKSTLTFTPKSEKDYGNLYCWASNDIGPQKIPCIFAIEPAGPPDPVNNCSIINQTQTVIIVDCKSGYDGGLPQTFICEVHDPSSPEVKRNLTSNRPSFLINDLRPGMNYIISIYSSNHKGRSESLFLTIKTLNSGYTENNGSEKLLTTILGVVIGIVVALAVIGISILIVMRLKASTRTKRKDYQPTEHTDRSSVPLRKDMDDCVENEEKSPDIICSTNEQEFPTVKVRCLQKWAYGSEVPCENCLRYQGMSSFSGGHIGCVAENTSSCRLPLRKIQPTTSSLL